MSLLVTSTLNDGIICVTVSGNRPAAQTRYLYRLCTVKNEVIEQLSEQLCSDARFDLGNLGCTGGGYYVEVVAEYKEDLDAAWSQETAKSNTVYYYQTYRLSYQELDEVELPDGQLVLYEIEKDGVLFELLLHPVLKSRQIVVFGNGRVHKHAALPFFHRLSWYSDVACSSVWYFDPSLYLGQARLCWGYGTNQRWYLRDIAAILEKIFEKLNISGNTRLFYGSSGGGFTSIMLACMLRGKAEVINPQYFPFQYYPSTVEQMQRSCLKAGEALQEERVNAVALFRREGFVPYIHCTQNAAASDDMYVQLLPFLEQVKEAFPEDFCRIHVTYLYSDRGHNAWPPQSVCIQMMQDALSDYDPRLSGQPLNVEKPQDFTVTCREQDGELIAAIQEDHPVAGTRYACYLLDRNGTAVQRHGYQRDPVFTFSAEPGAYVARGYVRAPSEGNGDVVTRAKSSQNVLVCPKVSLDYAEVDETHFRTEQLTIYEIHWDGVCFPFAVRWVPWAETAVVMSPGDLLESQEGDRFFQRISWAEELPGCAIYYLDPTPFQVENTLDWGYGTNQRWYLENIAVLLKKILFRLGIPLWDTLFFGSSGGGYMSILLASMLHGRAAVINPQLILKNYYPFQIKRFESSVLKPGEALIPHRTHVLELIRREGFFPPVQILQNRLSPFDLDQQIAPFLAQFYAFDGEWSENLTIRFYSQGGGSGALPQKADCLKFISDVLAGPAPEPGPAPGDFPASLLSRLEAGEFDAPSHPNRSAPSCDFSGVPIPKPIPAVPDGQTISCAQDLMGGRLWVYHRIEPMPYTLETLNFDTRFSRVPNSFQLYLQCLNPVQILTSAYVERGDMAYLLFAKGFLDSWLSYAASPNAEKNLYYFSSGHAVSLRAENLMYFGQACAKSGLAVGGLYELFFKHGVWLRDERNFNGTHNYGFMQNQALIHLGYVLDYPEWVTCAKKRLSAQLRDSFDSEYVHLENSPAYADMVIDLVQRTGAYLRAQQDPLGQALLDDIEKAQEFMRWAVKPDGTMAQIGDTPTAPPREAMDSRQPPPSGRRFFQQAGYYFYRSSGGAPDKQDTWKALKAGFTRTTHKHADDTSFLLYARGLDVFVDCGMYGYAQDDFRGYFRSAKAHNTVVTDDGTYPITQSKAHLLGVEEHRFSPEYDYIRVFNHAYSGVQFTREFISSGDATILIDRTSGGREHTYSQLFHLGEEAELLYASNDEVVVRLGKSGYHVRLRQFGPSPALSAIFGDVRTPGYGLISRGENHLSPIHTLKFDLSGKTGLWITVITVEDREGTVVLQEGAESYTNIFYDRARHCIALGKTKIPLS